jgi:hypothetical protein
MLITSHLEYLKEFCTKNTENFDIDHFVCRHTLLVFKMLGL